MSQIQNLRNQLLVDQLLELLQSANKKRVITENQKFFLLHDNITPMSSESDLSF